ncbi:hypothetical protein LQV63_11085 [Paenibacillus profundus]|uniref:Uncharacterized protein n=1 Tax=Paenibacillus profundus TaxID=1173085 RepID=A0ABS8YFL1_9BACL|nr:hypothetical protein [Paenibacillus profundus]MCE5169857.1 hypothetical protein [Paenibacillus profundus]
MVENLNKSRSIPYIGMSGFCIFGTALERIGTKDRILRIFYKNEGVLFNPRRPKDGASATSPSLAKLLESESKQDVRQWQRLWRTSLPDFSTSFPANKNKYLGGRWIMMSEFKMKRIYDPEVTDGVRVLVDRVWLGG